MELKSIHRTCRESSGSQISKEILLNESDKFIDVADATGVQFVADDELGNASGIGDLAVAAVDRDAGLDHLINPGINHVFVQFVRPDQ